MKFYETVFPFKHSSKNKDYEIEFQNTNRQYFFSSGLVSSNDTYDDKRENESVKTPKQSEVIDQSSLGGTLDGIVQDEMEHPDVKGEAISDDLENETLVDNDKISEGDDDYY